MLRSLESDVLCRLMWFTQTLLTLVPACPSYAYVGGSASNQHIIQAVLLQQPMLLMDLASGDNWMIVVVVRFVKIGIDLMGGAPFTFQRTLYKCRFNASGKEQFGLHVLSQNHLNIAFAIIRVVDILLAIIVV